MLEHSRYLAQDHMSKGLQKGCEPTQAGCPNLIHLPRLSWGVRVSVKQVGLKEAGYITQNPKGERLSHLAGVHKPILCPEHTTNYSSSKTN